MDDWKGMSMNDKDNKEDDETLDNYFFGISESIHNQSSEAWEGDNNKDSSSRIKNSSSSKPFKSPDSNKSRNKNSDSPKNSTISADSFDSVKRINKGEESDDLHNISAKLMERIHHMKQAKREMKKEKKKEKQKAERMEQLDFNFSNPTSFNPSPMGKSQANLAVVNEQDEIYHRKITKHKRAQSSSSNPQSKLEVQQAIAEFSQAQKLKELQLLNNCKVSIKWCNIIGTNITTQRAFEERNSYKICIA